MNLATPHGTLDYFDLKSQIMDRAANFFLDLIRPLYYTWEPTSFFAGD